MSDASVSTRLMTVTDLATLPDDGKRYELNQGELVVMPPPKPDHGKVVIKIGALVLTFVESHDLGEVMTEAGFLLATNPDTVRAPDIAYVAKSRIPATQGEYYPFAPDLAIEVVSPANTDDEIAEKIAQYFAAGARQVWVIYPRARVIYVYRSAKEVTIFDVNDTLEGGDLLHGFAVSVRDIFAQLKPLAQP